MVSGAAGQVPIMTTTTINAVQSTIPRTRSGDICSTGWVTAATSVVDFGQDFMGLDCIASNVPRPLVERLQGVTKALAGAFRTLWTHGPLGMFPRGDRP